MLKKCKGAILARRAAIAESLVACEFSQHPELVDRYGRIARDKSLQDAGYHLEVLAESIGVNHPELFIEYIAWAKVTLCKRGIRAADLAFHLACMKEALQEQLPVELASPACGFVDAGLNGLPGAPDDHPECIWEGMPYFALARSYLQFLLRWERNEAWRLIIDAVNQGTSIRDLYLHVFQPSQYEIGRLWQLNRLSVGQEHYCTAATQLIMSQLYPQVFAAPKSKGVLVAVCAPGEQHEIGMRMLADLLELDGWNTIFLGANMPTKGVVETVAERKADILAISATTTTRIGAVQSLVGTVRDSVACRGTKILVGGRPFIVAPTLWQGVGADGSAVTAQAAIALAGQLVMERASR